MTGVETDRRIPFNGVLPSETLSEALALFSGSFVSASVPGAGPGGMMNKFGAPVFVLTGPDARAGDVNGLKEVERDGEGGKKVIVFERRRRALMVPSPPSTLRFPLGSNNGTCPFSAVCRDTSAGRASISSIAELLGGCGEVSKRGERSLPVLDLGVTEDDAGIIGFGKGEATSSVVGVWVSICAI